jgi:hypothetical protein
VHGNQVAYQFRNVHGPSLRRRPPKALFMICCRRWLSEAYRRRADLVSEFGRIERAIGVAHELLARQTADHTLQGAPTTLMVRYTTTSANRGTRAVRTWLCRIRTCMPQSLCFMDDPSHSCSAIWRAHNLAGQLLLAGVALISGQHWPQARSDLDEHHWPLMDLALTSRCSSGKSPARTRIQN